MARLGSDLKMGFYPTPSGALEEIPRFLDADGNEEHLCPWAYSRVQQCPKGIGSEMMKSSR